ncbi:MAG TPA: hypothetical protein VF485_13775 [Sphingomonas sp.]
MSAPPHRASIHQSAVKFRDSPSARSPATPLTDAGSLLQVTDEPEWRWSGSLT